MQDRARIHVKAGSGGDGALSFRREAHVPKGGPDGGDGGRGGDVVLVCDGSARDLERFRHASHFKAPRGGHGQGALRHGAEGKALEIRVPPGTEITVESASTRHDLVRDGQRATVARGGSPGRGNKRFAGPTHQTPRFAERGLAGEETWLTLRLKLLADAGLIGLPNAGKSSLLSRLTRAHPRVADYPFTTLEPALGTLELSDSQLIIADIPGLIEGASEGAGLGHQFLAHVERTRLLVHVLDLSPLDGSDPRQNFETIEREVSRYDARLGALPRILALSKADLVPEPEAKAARERWRALLGEHVPVLLTSAATGQGLGELAGALARGIEAARGVAPGPGVAPAHRAEAARGIEPGLDPTGAPAPPDAAELAEHRVFRPAAERHFDVERAGPHSFKVSGARIDRLIARYDLDNEEALAHLERRLRGIGVISHLEAAGFEPGDEVEIGGVVFDLDPEV